jgi:hypothetical protein
MSQTSGSFCLCRIQQSLAIAAAPVFVEKLDASFNVRAEHRQQSPSIPVVAVATPGLLVEIAVSRTAQCSAKRFPFGMVRGHQYNFIIGWINLAESFNWTHGADDTAHY